MKRSYLSNIIMFIALTISTSISYGQIRPGNAGSFLDGLAKIINNKTVLEGKNWGPMGPSCSVVIQKGSGRSSNFQTIVKIEMKDNVGNTKSIVQLNLLSVQNGFLFTETTAEGTYNGFSYKANGIENTIMYLHAPSKNYLHIDIESKMFEKKLKGYCSIYM